MARHDAGRLEPGTRSFHFEDEDHLSDWNAGLYRVTVKAASTYDDGFGDEVIVDADLRGASAGALPRKLQLLGNHPNPFNPTTTISYQLSHPDIVNLSIYDVNGNLIATLERGWQESGRYAAIFDGSKLSSGIYVYHLMAGGYAATGKMVLMK